MKVEELRIVLKDKEVKSLFVELFTDKIDQSVQSNNTKLVDDIMEKFAKNFDDVAKKFDDVNANVVSLRAEIQHKDVVINDLKAENQELKNAVQSLKLKLDNSEAYQHRGNLIFAGLECFGWLTELEL